MNKIESGKPIFSSYELKNPEEVLEFFSEEELRGLKVINHHVTVVFGEHATLPPKAVVEVTSTLTVPGACIALCTVNGEPCRQDGKRYHITVALTDGIPPFVSNNLIETHIDQIEPVMDTPISTAPHLLIAE